MQLRAAPRMGRRKAKLIPDIPDRNIVPPPTRLAAAGMGWLVGCRTEYGIDTTQKILPLMFFAPVTPRQRVHIYMHALVVTTNIICMHDVFILLQYVVAYVHVYLHE